MDGVKIYFTDSVSLGNGLNVGVRESEGVKKDPYISGMSNYRKWGQMDFEKSGEKRSMVQFLDI